MCKLQLIALDRNVAVAGGFQSVVASPFIGANGASPHNAVLNKGGETVTGSICKHAKAHAPNTFIPFIFDRNTYQHLACSPTTAFARLFSPTVGFVHFNDARQIVAAGAYHG